MAIVLLLEDEPVLRSSMARGLSKLPGVTVVEAGTLQAALEAIDADPPQMIISDIDLPDRSGLELLGELGRRNLAIPILYVSAYLKAYGALIPPHANVDVREKPIDLQDLRAIVRQRLASSNVSDAPFGPSDYIQLACLGHRSVLIEVKSPRGEGFIVVHQGVLWTASDKEGEGEQAFRRLVFLPDAVARVRSWTGNPGKRTIERGWEALLLDAARELDERSKEADDVDAAFDEVGGITLDLDSEFEKPSAPDPAPVARPASAVPAAPAVQEEDDPFTRAFDEGVSALLVKDYKKAYDAFAKAASYKPDDAKTKANLERLRQLGFGPEDA